MPPEHLHVKLAVPGIDAKQTHFGRAPTARRLRCHLVLGEDDAPFQLLPARIPAGGEVDSAPRLPKRLPTGGTGSSRCREVRKDRRQGVGSERTDEAELARPACRYPVCTLVWRQPQHPVLRYLDRLLGANTIRGHAINGIGDLQALWSARCCDRAKGGVRHRQRQSVAPDGCRESGADIGSPVAGPVVGAHHGESPEFGREIRFEDVTAGCDLDGDVVGYRVHVPPEVQALTAGAPGLGSVTSVVPGEVTHPWTVRQAGISEIEGGLQAALGDQRRLDTHRHQVQRRMHAGFHGHILPIDLIAGSLQAGPQVQGPLESLDLLRKEIAVVPAQQAETAQIHDMRVVEHPGANSLCLGRKVIAPSIASLLEGTG